MTGEEVLSRIRTRQVADLRACFPKLHERDLMQILCSTPKQAVYILQQCFGCSIQDAQAAWNDYVLRYIDGGAANHPVSRIGGEKTFLRVQEP